MKLLSNQALQRSSTVANCTMNRERSLTGSNGYSRELGLNPLDTIWQLLDQQGTAAWLDLCCGTGRALLEASQLSAQAGFAHGICLVGIDLAGHWAASDRLPAGLQLVQSSLESWQPGRSFDLITCVHGLHYVGDKLDLLRRAATWLTPEGSLIANLDLNNIQLRNKPNSTRTVATLLRTAGFEYDSRKKLLSLQGKRSMTLPVKYLGANDQAGPNYTGQAAIDSHYELM